MTATGTTTLATSLSGLLKATSGVVSAATAGTDYVAVGGALGTPSSGTVTNLTGTASININGTVGATTASTGAFTTLSASSTVSGTGFSTYLASPPAIGGTTPAAGTFTGIIAKGTTNTPKLNLDSTTINSTAWTTQGIGLRIGAIVGSDTSSTGTVALVAMNSIDSGGIGTVNTGVTITDLANLYISGAPITTTPTNTTVTNNWAIYANAKIKATDFTGSIGATTANTGKFTTLTWTGATVETVYTSGSTTGTITPTSTNGTTQKITLTGNITFNGFTSPVAGQSMTLIITQPASGGPYTLTSTMKFSGGSKTLSTTASAIDIMTVFYDGTNYYASLAKGFA